MLKSDDDDDEHFFPASDTRLSLVGRYQQNDDANQSKTFEWPSVHLTASVTSPSATIWLSEPPPGVPNGSCT